MLHVTFCFCFVFDFVTCPRSLFDLRHVNHIRYYYYYYYYVRAATAGSRPPEFTHTECVLGSFEGCSRQTVEKIIRNSASKSCDLDPAPTFLIKEFLGELLPFLTRMCNASIRQGHLPVSQKEAIVTPILKKSDLDPSDVKNYRPISNLPFMSKVVEKVVLGQLSVHLSVNDLFPKFQSGFRRGHSTESALLRVMSDIYAAIDTGKVSLLALLDVSAAFDTVDHSILLERFFQILRSHRLGPRVVRVIYIGASTDRSIREYHGTDYPGSFRYTPGLSPRPNPVHSLYGRCRLTCGIVWTPGPPLRRRHSALRFQLTRRFCRPGRPHP